MDDLVRSLLENVILSGVAARLQPNFLSNLLSNSMH